jgi:dolichol-phosphate mannosyltransferase
MVDLSVIVAVYNEDPRNLSRMIDRLSGVLSPLYLSWEVVFVNDGSNPTTSAALRRIAGEADNVKLIELSRNFGQQAAITAGLDHADGQAVVNIDSDLQDPPELIPEMIKCWQEGYEVVYAQRATRKDHVAKRLSAHLFYRMLACVSSVEIPWDTGDFRLMDRKVVEALKELPEKTRFLRGMIPWLGFRQIGIPVDRGARELGESTYTFRKLLMLAMDGLLAFMC